jgi:predicted ArsR family transcriptional regulator
VDPSTETTESGGHIPPSPGLPADSRQAALQRQARALGDPTRFAIFNVVAEAPGGVTVAALTTKFGLNHNAVRQHLAKLCEAGLLVEEFGVRTGPGRPPLMYRPGPGVPGTWATQGPYQQLAALLLDVMTSGLTPREVGRADGYAAAARLQGGAAPGSSVVRLIEEMSRRGFEPHLSNRSGTEEVVLGYCPFATAAKAHPDVVCEIHRGLAEGFLAAAGGDVEVTALQLRDPGTGGCRLELRATRIGGQG